MRTTALLLILALSACGPDGAMFENDKIISDLGGRTIVLANGVCILIDETEDDDRAFIVPMSYCEV
ncbi:MAG: hypothetical protein AAGD13_19570 [Pseudomonadota bacterium]